MEVKRILIRFHFETIFCIDWEENRIVKFGTKMYGKNYEQATFGLNIIIKILVNIDFEITLKIYHVS